MVINLVSFLSYCFLNISSLTTFVFMQDSAKHHAVHIEPRKTQDDLRNVVPDFSVEKTSDSTVAVTVRTSANAKRREDSAAVAEILKGNIPNIWELS